MVLDDGTVDEFMRHAEELHAELAPVGKLEEVLVDRIISLSWRLARAGHIERGLLMLGRGDRSLPAPARLALAFRHDALRADSFGKLGRYETRLERSLLRSLRELDLRQASRRGIPAPTAVDIDIVIEDHRQAG